MYLSQVFSDMEFLGWYTTGDKPGPEEIFVHKQIMEINESPLFLQLSPGNTNNKAETSDEDTHK